MRTDRFGSFSGFGGGDRFGAGEFGGFGGDRVGAGGFAGGDRFGAEASAGLAGGSAPGASGAEASAAFVAVDFVGEVKGKP